MVENTNKFLAEVTAYYSNKLSQYGATPKGVDWNGEESQVLRFEQLYKLMANSDAFSINDLGCGYGALYEFLINKRKKIEYCGVDVCSEMVVYASEIFRKDSNVRFIQSHLPDKIADYSVASGIFNVRLGKSDEEWFLYLKSTLETLDNSSRLGFAFNCLTSHSDKHKMLKNLYYVDPNLIFNLCKSVYSTKVALLHDYDLYEFTILVRK
jgi:SAM-dependent methyltransferase